MKDVPKSTLEKVAKLRALASQLNMKLVVIEDHGITIEDMTVISPTRPTRIYGIEVLNGHLPLESVVQAIKARDEV